MTFPATSTPLPSVHSNPFGSSTPGVPLPNLMGALEGLLEIPEELAQGILNALVSVFTGVENVVNATANDVEAAVGAFITTTTNAIDTVVTDTAQLAVQIETAVANAITTAVKAAGNLVGDIITVGDDAIKIIGQIFTDIFSFLGNPSVGNNGGGSTSPGTDNNGQSLQQLLALLDKGTDIPAPLLKALAPGTSNNVLTDPNFNTGSYIQGQGLWCWDGWVGTGAFEGINSSIRTIRPGKIVIYNIIGTSGSQYFWGNEPVNIGGSGQVLEYLRDEEFSFLVDWALVGTDPGDMPPTSPQWERTTT